MTDRDDRDRHHDGAVAPDTALRRDIRFLFDELLHADRLGDFPGLEPATPAAIAETLDKAEGFCRSLDAATSDPARDAEGAPVTGQPLRALVDSGLLLVGADRAAGGRGFPQVVASAITELLATARPPLAGFTAVTQATAAMLAEDGAEPIRGTYLEPLASGRWRAAIDHAVWPGREGAPADAIAEPAADGLFQITGSARPLWGGADDLAENILHLVPARLPNAPAGAAGASLFLLPSRFVGGDGRLGEGNRIRCRSDSRRRGALGLPAGTADYDGASGHLVGAPHGASGCIARMHRLARLGLAMQGAGLAEKVFRATLADAPVAALERADLRDMLMIMKARVEGQRALGYWTALNVDMARHHTDRRQRQASADLVEMMTPVIKMTAGAGAFAVADLAQRLGAEWGEAEKPDHRAALEQALQFRTAPWSELVDALDLLERRLPERYGRLLRRFFQPVDTFLVVSRTDERLAALGEPLAAALAQLQQATIWLIEARRRETTGLAAVASDYARLFGLVAMGFLWAQMALVAFDRLDEEAEEAAFYEAKIATARFFMHRLLPRASGLAAAVVSGGELSGALDDRGA